MFSFVNYLCGVAVCATCVFSCGLLCLLYYLCPSRVRYLFMYLFSYALCVSSLFRSSVRSLFLPLFRVSNLLAYGCTFVICVVRAFVLSFFSYFAVLFFHYLLRAFVLSFFIVL